MFLAVLGPKIQVEPGIQTRYWEPDLGTQYPSSEILVPVPFHIEILLRDWDTMWLKFGVPSSIRSRDTGLNLVFRPSTRFPVAILRDLGTVPVTSPVSYRNHFLRLGY